METTKVLWIGDGGVSTGFARVNHSIISRFPKRFEIHHLAVNYKGDPYPDAKHAMYPAGLGGDILGLNRLPPLMEALKPDLVFILNDPWILADYLTKIKIGTKVIAYTPVDAKPLDEFWVESANKISQLITYTEYGKSAYTDILPAFTNIEIIPHGIDTKKFHPLNKAKARKDLGGIPEDAFIIFNGNRNQPRKRIDITMKAFQEFAKDKDDVRLYLHMGIVDAGYDIVKLAKRYGFIDKLIVTSLNLSPGSSVSDETLNKIYNTADVGINTSTGEGWGLVSMEQACCKVPQIVPNSSACEELFTDNMGLRIEISSYQPNPMVLTEGAVVSIEDAVSKLNTYYYNRELMREHAENAYNKFMSKTYSWDNIANQFVDIFDRVLAQEEDSEEE